MQEELRQKALSVLNKNASSEEEIDIERFEAGGKNTLIWRTSRNCLMKRKETCLLLGWIQLKRNGQAHLFSRIIR